MKKALLVILATPAFCIGLAAADPPDKTVVYDYTRPGQEILFFYTTRDTVVLEGEYRYKDVPGGDWSDWVPWPGNEGFDEVNPGSGIREYEFRAKRGNEDRVTDWHQKIKSTNESESHVYGGNIRAGSEWSFYPLQELPDVYDWRIPDIAPMADAAIYTAVNLDLYLRLNPQGFLDGDWSVGDTLSSLGITVTDGVIPGVEGLYLSVSPFHFDPAETGFGFMPEGGLGNLLDSSSYGVDLEIIAQHKPTPGVATILFLGCVGAMSRRRR